MTTTTEDKAMTVSEFVRDYPNEWDDMVAIQNRHTDRDHLTIAGCFTKRSQFLSHLRSLEDMHMGVGQ